MESLFIIDIIENEFRLIIDGAHSVYSYLYEISQENYSLLPSNLQQECITLDILKNKTFLLSTHPLPKTFSSVLRPFNKLSIQESYSLAFLQGMKTLKERTFIAVISTPNCFLLEDNKEEKTFYDQILELICNNGINGSFNQHRSFIQLASKDLFFMPQAIGVILNESISNDDFSMKKTMFDNQPVLFVNIGFKQVSFIFTNKGKLDLFLSFQRPLEDICSLNNPFSEHNLEKIAAYIKNTLDDYFPSSKALVLSGKKSFLLINKLRDLLCEQPPYWRTSDVIVSLKGNQFPKSSNLAVSHGTYKGMFSYIQNRKEQDNNVYQPKTL